MRQRASPAGLWLSYSSGYGGIEVVMFINCAVYYFVSDSASYAFGGAKAELHKIIPNGLID